MTELVLGPATIGLGDCYFLFSFIYLFIYFLFFWLFTFLIDRYFLRKNSKLNKCLLLLKTFEICLTIVSEALFIVLLLMKQVGMLDA